MHGASAISGIGESNYYGWGKSPHSEFQLACTAIQRAVEDAGLDLADVDGFVSYTDQRNLPTRLARALGVRELRWVATTWPGGGNSVAAAVQLADAAVSAGYAHNVVVFRALAQGQYGRFGLPGPAVGGGDGPYMSGPFAWNGTYGVLTPAQQCALRTARFMHDYGISQEALCEVALACYANAQRNPRALRYGKPLTREKYHSSRWIVTPFHLYDCCPENDGAAACVVTSSERAKDLPNRPASIVAAAQGIGPGFGVFTPEDLASSHYRQVAEHLWNDAGMRPEDVDVAQFYENFTGPVLIALCEMGFTSPENVEKFVSDGALVGPDAKLPFNTAGGNIGEAYIHGFELINESVRQIRGESTCQVSGVERALVVGGPGYAPGSALLLGAPA
jgi:acetyl-CoA acetyltransferase